MRSTGSVADSIPNAGHARRIAAELGIRQAQVETTARLLADDATVPFIARYRKEATGGLDEVAIISIRDTLERLETLGARRAAIRSSMLNQGVLTDELSARLDAAGTLAQLEDVYLPFRPRRRTKAMIAREKGLEPLAVMLMNNDGDPDAVALGFVNAEKGIATASEALAGARDVIAEIVSEDSDARAAVRDLYGREASIRSSVIKGKEDDGAKFRDYFTWEEPAASAPSHRVLAIRRGADEKVLSVRLTPPEGDALAVLHGRFLRPGPASDHVERAIEDGYRRLLGPSMEAELRSHLKQRADGQAIAVFSENLRNLLMASPLGCRAVLAIDPGLRTGCKAVCLDPQGRLLAAETIFPLEPFRRTAEAAATLLAMVGRFGSEAIAIGNGTGGREAMAFCGGINLPRPIPIVMVNESGASVYSASEVARQELPDHDVTVRGAVSIGRRLIDPLAELVKIDPKSIGVGQYQHDVEQKALRRALDDVVSSCVNAVGVEVNTASAALLRHVSGLSERLADAVVAHRDVHGPFRSRADLLDIRGMGPKTFQQAAGFLRIRDGTHPLDASAVHPESYSVVERMAADLHCTVSDLMRNDTLRASVPVEHYVSDHTGLPTLRDIMEELAKPGRDPREPFDPFVYDDRVRDIGDLSVGMRLPGLVTNVTAFGAFVDIGVHHDGLVHKSELADRFVPDPGKVVKVHQRVMVTVIGVDLARQRISLSMRADPLTPKEPRAKSPSPERVDPDRGRVAQRDGERRRPPPSPFAALLNRLEQEPE